MQHHRRWHLQLLERVRCRLEMPSREVQIHRRVLEIGMAEQHLNRPQVGTCFEQMRGVGMPQRILTLPMNRLPRSFIIDTIPSTVNT